MKEIQIDELRELQMQILDYVDAFCRKHGINYTISGGTLLGAIRHGGYIPWDDDMDVQMLRSEYNRFTELWNQQKGEHGCYELINIESGNSMGYPFGKVHDTRTVTYIGELERSGVYIDVFPVDYVKDEQDFMSRHEEIKHLYQERALVFRKMRQKTEAFNLKSWLQMLFKHVPDKTYNQIAEEINQLAMSCTDVQSPYVFEMISGMKCKHPIPHEVFQEYNDICFENRQYMAVKDFDTYLERTFGDYMTPPPESQRHRHQNCPFWR